MWKKFEVELRMSGRFAASLPKTEEEIKVMLENRMPAKRPEDYIPIEQLASEVIGKVDAATGGEEESAEVQYGWATFPRNEDGIYYEGRCIRGHLKDCANQVKDVLKPEVKALKAKVANKVYVMTDVIPLHIELDQLPGPVYAKEIDGTEKRFIQVMTPKGPRSTIKYIDYLLQPTLKFQLNVLDDGIITPEILEAIFEYGSVHGLGQERSQGWGRYNFTITELAELQ